MRRVVSLACVRVRYEVEGKLRFVGCGRGWEQDYSEEWPPTCERCGRPARITGSYTVMPLR